MPWPSTAAADSGRWCDLATTVPSIAVRSLARQLQWVFLAIACVRAPPEQQPVQQPPPPPPIVVPEGCLADLSGPWVHEVDARFRYEASDTDAGLMLLGFFDQPVDAGKAPRRFSRSRDGGLPWLVTADAGAESSAASDAGPLPRAVLQFSRTSGGFVGETLAFDGGCRFPAAIVECGAALVIEAPAALASDCAPLDAGWSRQTLRRIGLDAGSDTLRHEAHPDAGAAEDAGERAAPAP
jgi:hypothetical protein